MGAKEVEAAFIKLLAEKCVDAVVGKRCDVIIKSIEAKRTGVFREKARKKTLEKRELFSKNAKKQ